MEKWKGKLKALFDAYGPVAIGVFVVINLLVIGGAAVALSTGWSPATVAGTASVWAGAYLIYKLVMPARIALALLLTPLVARILGRKPKLPA